MWQGTGNVVDLNTNIGSLSTKGVDMSVSYTGLELGGLGELSFNLVGTYLDELTYVSGITGIAPTNARTSSPARCAASRIPTGGITSASAGRRRGTSTCRSPGDTIAAVTNIADATKPNIDYGLGARSFIDLAANWAVTEKASVLLGINNVLDKDPPLSSAVGTTGNGNTYPQTYDALGRWIFMRGQIAF